MVLRYQTVGLRYNSLGQRPRYDVNLCCRL